MRSATPVTAPRTWLARLANCSSRHLVEVGLALALPSPPLALARAACGRTSPATRPFVERRSLGFIEIKRHLSLFCSGDVLTLDEFETVLLL